MHFDAPIFLPQRGCISQPGVVPSAGEGLPWVSANNFLYSERVGSLPHKRIDVKQGWRRDMPFSCNSFGVVSFRFASQGWPPHLQAGGQPWL
jgi:hypothetical protein